MSVDVPKTAPWLAIIDDDGPVRVGLSRLCTALGMRATVHGSGHEFIDAIDAGGTLPDCLVLDTQMPGMTGFEMQRVLAARSLRIPTVVVTADDSAEARARYVAAGVTEFLPKPIDGDELLAAIERAMRAGGTRG